MAQFDLYRLKGGQLVVDLQTDLIGIEASRIVVPLRDAGRYTAFPGLTPSVELDGTAWIVRVQELAAIPGMELRDRVCRSAGISETAVHLFSMLCRFFIFEIESEFMRQ